MYTFYAQISECLRCCGRPGVADSETELRQVPVLGAAERLSSAEAFRLFACTLACPEPRDPEIWRCRGASYEGSAEHDVTEQLLSMPAARRSEEAVPRAAADVHVAVIYSE